MPVPTAAAALSPAPIQTIVFVDNPVSSLAFLVIFPPLSIDLYIGGNKSMFISNLSKISLDQHILFISNKLVPDASDGSVPKFPVSLYLI